MIECKKYHGDIKKLWTKAEGEYYDRSCDKVMEVEVGRLGTN